jgi:hypothetical protein
MNYDNLHTTSEILEAFQGCRDAGEEIDLFEALAWRDEPPVEAFIEIVRKIKLEPVLALATQALGWVKNAEVLERLKKSDELLEILSNLAMSGATDLIRWSAAKSIIAIGFDFISVAQYLVETPQLIIGKTQRLKIGDVFVGRVAQIIPIGAFIEFLPGKQALVHISQVANYKVSKMEDEVSIGDKIVVKIREIDHQGRLNLTCLGIHREEEVAARQGYLKLKILT